MRKYLCDHYSELLRQSLSWTTTHTPVTLGFEPVMVVAMAMNVPDIAMVWLRFCSRSHTHCWLYMSNFICLVGLTEGGGRMAGGRGRRATSLQPMGFGGGSGFSQSTNMNSNRLSRLNSQQDSSYSSSTTSSSSYSTSSNIGGSGPRTRRVSDIDNQYYSSSNGGKKLINRGICWAAAASNPRFAL